MLELLGEIPNYASQKQQSDQLIVKVPPGLSLLIFLSSCCAHNPSCYISEAKSELVRTIFLLYFFVQHIVFPTTDFLMEYAK